MMTTRFSLIDCPYDWITGYYKDLFVSYPHCSLF